MKELSYVYAVFTAYYAFIDMSKYWWIGAGRIN